MASNYDWSASSFETLAQFMSRLSPVGINCINDVLGVNGLKMEDYRLNPPPSPAQDPDSFCQRTDEITFEMYDKIGIWLKFWNKREVWHFGKELAKVDIQLVRRHTEDHWLPVN